MRGGVYAKFSYDAGKPAQPTGMSARFRGRGGEGSKLTVLESFVPNSASSKEFIT